MSGNGRFTSETGREAARRSNLVQRRLTLPRVESELGPLRTAEDALHWREQLGYWMAAGRLKHGSNGALAQLVNGVSRDLEIQQDREDFEALAREHDRVKARNAKLEKELARLKA